MLRRPGLPQAGLPADAGRPRPLIERIAHWSTRHAKTAVIGWFALIGIAFAAGQLLGTQSLPQYDPGQAGVGEQALHQLHVSSPPAESVLIQLRGPESDRLTYATDPQMRQAVRQVAQTLGHMHATAMHVDAADRSGTSGLVSANGRSALVTFQVPGSRTTQAGNVAADLAAVARIQATFPGLLVAEAGDASASAASNSLLESDFRRAEYTAIPLTLILLLIVFATQKRLFVDPARRRDSQ